MSPKQTIAHYRITAKLGEGGMGEVWRATDTKLDRDVAIKILPAAFAADAGRMARFEREAKVLASLNHPNIAAVYGLEQSDDIDCLVLELVEGETLRGPLPVDRALDYARQVADALEGAHSQGIVHRDLKPANVKVTPQDKVKVLDFGLAKAIGGLELQELAQAPATIGGGTLTGHVLGTPGYMSPEQTRAEAVDERTDIWAFGCLLYELLAGKRAFDAALEHEPDWRALPSKMPAKIRELLRQCFAEGRGSTSVQYSGGAPGNRKGAAWMGSMAGGCDRRRRVGDTRHRCNTVVTEPAGHIGPLAVDPVNKIS